MENMEMLVRGVMMQNPGLGLGSMSFQGVELLWVVVIATILLALVSVTRVSVVSVGWTWGSTPGQVRVRVQSFSSLSNSGIVTASGMFSAEILNCSADSCSEDASSSSDCASEDAEMVFIFDKKATSLVTTTLPKQQASPARAAPEKIVRKRPKSQDFQKKETPLFLSPPISLPRCEGIEWDASPASLSSRGVNSLLPAWAQSLGEPLVYRAPPLPSRVVRNTFSGEWDPLLKIRIRDAVVTDGSSFFSVNDLRSRLAPVAIHGSSIATLKDDVVGVWDRDAKLLMKSVRLPKGCSDAATALDVNWESRVAAMGMKGGMVSIANLESAAYENSYQTQQPVVQSLHLDRTSSKTIFTGGPAVANPGCSVSLWDSRSSREELSLNLSSASVIYGIRSHGQELFVRDEAGSLAAHDVRMLGASSVGRVPCEVKFSSAPEDRWWDIDTAFECDQEDDIDDDVMDCQTTTETKPAGASSMSSLVTVMSRNFSSKALSQ